jgi:hypothetical protein
VRILKPKINKLQAKMCKGIFVKYDDHSKAYRCYDPIKQKIIVTQDMNFDEMPLFQFIDYHI